MMLELLGHILLFAKPDHYQVKKIEQCHKHCLFFYLIMTRQPQAEINMVTSWLIAVRQSSMGSRHEITSSSTSLVLQFIWINLMNTNGYYRGEGFGQALLETLYALANMSIIMMNLVMFQETTIMGMQQNAKDDPKFKSKRGLRNQIIFERTRPLLIY